VPTRPFCASKGAVTRKPCTVGFATCINAQDDTRDFWPICSILVRVQRPYIRYCALYVAIGEHVTGWRGVFNIRVERRPHFCTSSCRSYQALLLVQDDGQFAHEDTFRRIRDSRLGQLAFMKALGVWRNAFPPLPCPTITTFILFSTTSGNGSAGRGVRVYRPAHGDYRPDRRTIFEPCPRCRVEDVLRAAAEVMKGDQISFHFSWTNQWTVMLAVDRRGQAIAAIRSLKCAIAMHPCITRKS
jgi:hypothetical protein